MSFVEKLSKDKARNILFFTSLSVILITLGIIQTLLFETITFFSEIAAERGWLTFTIALGDIFSAQGLASILFMLLAKRLYKRQMLHWVILMVIMNPLFIYYQEMLLYMVQLLVGIIIHVILYVHINVM